MADDTRDILMKMMQGPVPVDSECKAVIAKGDTLASGFMSSIPSNRGGTRPNYFAIKDFTFQVALSGDGAAKGAAAAQNEQSKLAMQEIEKKLKDRSPELAGLQLNAPKNSAEFQRFMANGRADMRVKTYPADLEAISVTKELDATSLTLLKGCVTSVTFKNATLLKRKATGDNELRTYLRIDFTDLLITEFNWDEDEVVTEKFKFVCRKAIVQYAVETDDGNLLTPAGTGKWSVLNLGGS